MKKTIILTESDLRRIIRRAIKENEEEWINQSQDMEGESDFSTMKLQKSEDFNELVAFFKENPEAAEKIKKALSMGVNENYEYYDYSESKPKKITKNKFLRRKLITYGIATLVSGAIGYTLGVMSGDQIIQAALLAAGMGGATFGTLSSEVGRVKKKDEENDDQITEMEDVEFMKGADKNWNDRYYEKDDFSDFDTTMYDGLDDEEWGETDEGEEKLQDLIEEARDFLENECGYDLHDINLMSEEDIVEALYDEGNDELAEEIEELLNQEGF